jgi:hypothetical protein
MRRLIGSGSCQQRADVEACPKQHGVQRVALGTLEPTPIHAVIGLGVAGQRIDSLALLDPNPPELMTTVSIQMRLL